MCIRDSPPTNLSVSPLVLPSSTPPSLRTKRNLSTLCARNSSSYAMSGTEVGYAATRHGPSFPPPRVVLHPASLCPSYVRYSRSVSCEVVLMPISLCPSYAMSGTSVAYRAMSH
eukprot:3936420-Rhodomonas_salina.2